MAKIEGYALIFNSESRNLGGFTEIIKPEAMNGIILQADVIALIEHDKSKGVLARSTNNQGTLKLSVDNLGLKYSFTPPDTPAGVELVEGIKRGDIRTSSFAFRVGENGQKWSEKPDGTYLRTITQFSDLHDVSAVIYEAYSDTSVKLINT